MLFWLGEGYMQDRATLSREADDLRREISALETQIKSLRDYIGTQERNLRNAAESVRSITERSLAEARGDLHLKDLRLQQLRQDLQAKQVYVSKIAEIERKEQDVQTLERERDRISAMLARAQADLQQLNDQFGAMVSPSFVPEYTLVFTSGERFPLPTDGSEALVGCADTGVFPTIDLTPLGGTTRGVSRRHATLRFSGGQWTLTDLSSTNGTYVNTIKIAPHVPTPVHDQAKLRFGNLDAVLTTSTPPAGKTTRL